MANPYGHAFGDQATTQPGASQDENFGTQNLLHSARGGVMGGNEYRVLNKPRFRVVSTAAQNINNATNTAVTFDAAGDYDTDSMYNPTTSQAYVTVKTAGVWMITGAVYWTGSGAGNVREGWIGVTGSLPINTKHGTDWRGIWGVAIQNTCNMSVLLSLLANDQISLGCYQDTGGGLTLSATPMNVTTTAWMAGVLVSTL